MSGQPGPPHGPGSPPRPWTWPLLLLAAGLVVRLVTAWALQHPGYTDAYYYAVGARELYYGHGLRESFIWNYLDPPPAVAHPGYAYWMPLSAILGWLGMLLLGDSFRAMQAPFVLLAALLPPLTYLLAYDVVGSLGLGTRARHRHALLAGLLALVPGFYAHVLVVPDNFAPFALAGSVCLWAAGRGLRGGRPAWFALAGLAAGLAHLSRADGLLLAGVALLAALVSYLPWSRKSSWLAWAAGLAAVALGYLLAMGPWLARNWLVFGSPLPSAGARTLFLTTYDDMFAYGRPLNLQTYLSWGWAEILKSKGQALLLNLQRLWVESLLVVLLPFTTLGLWRLRRDRLLWPFLLYLPLLFLAMTLAFTFPGTRGGLYHSAGALLPFFFAAAGPGLDVALRWAARRLPHWQVRRAWPVFAGGLVVLAALLTGFALARAGVLDGEWNRRDWGYAALVPCLQGQDGAGAVIMVGNAPGFAWHTGRPAVAIPNEPLDVILAVAARYDARFLLLDETRPRSTDDLYSGEAQNPRLHPVCTVDRWQLYEIRP